MANNIDFIESVIKTFAIPDVNARSFTLEEQNRTYKFAYDAYKERKYGNAEILFKQLLFSNPFDERFWKGYGGALQLQQKYLEALHAWAALALLENEDPSPHLHAAECYLFLDNKEEAQKALTQAEERLSSSHPLNVNGQFEKLKMVLSHDS